MTKITRPTHFFFYNDMWVIQWHDVDSDVFGVTKHNQKEIIMYCKNVDEAMLKEKLLHELEHVLALDIFDVILPHMKNADPDDIEEAHICMITPRRRQLYNSNPALINYLFETKEVKT